MITIRPYTTADAAALTAVHNQLSPDDTLTPRRLNGRLSAWRLSWVSCVDETPVGYVYAAPLPGLPGQYQLEVMVGRAWQRQGLGSQLLAFLRQALAGGEVIELSCGLTESQEAAAAFLQQNGFVFNHQELILARPHLADLPSLPSRPRLHLRTYPRRKAVRLFCRLYAASFAGHPWNQPYTQDEAAADLVSARDILFLTGGKRPFGFAWLHGNKNGEGQIEPMGILPAAQGEGYGRYLLIAALHTLKQRGARRAIIGVWADNRPARRLYESLGFRPRQTITYYACRL
jgi:mycothiol synthase